MFKSSQEIRLNNASAAVSTVATSSSSSLRFSHYERSDNQNACVLYGKYQKSPDSDIYSAQPPQVFVAPELTDTSKVQLLHFPMGALRVNSCVDFVIKRNGIKGNFEVKLESPSGQISYVPLKIINPERIEVGFYLTEPGLYKVHIKCNSVSLPKSPYIIVAISGNELEMENKIELPIFKSDALKVTSRGVGLNQIVLHERNEFIIDGSAAGNNILFVGIFGPKGQCDEVVVKHMGKNIYKVTYKVEDPGDYLLAAKWGDDHIPGSPFSLSAM